MSRELATPLDLGAAVAGVPRGWARLRWRLLSIGLAPALVILLVMVVVCGAVDRSASIARGLTQTSNIISDIVLLRQAVVNQETAVSGYAIVGDESFLEPYEAGAAAFKDVVQSLQPHIARDPALGQAVARVVDLHERWTTEIAEREIAAVRSGDLESARQLVGTRSGKAITDEIRAATGAIIEADVSTLSGYDPDAGGADEGPLAARIPGSLFVAKPFDPGELAAAVAEVLSNPVADRSRPPG